MLLSNRNILANSLFKIMYTRITLERIRQVRETFQLAENTGDVELASTIFAHDIIAVSPDKKIIKSKQAGIKYLRARFTTYDIQINYESQSIKINGDFVYEWATYHQETIHKQTREKQLENGRVFWLYHKKEEKWLQQYVVWSKTEAQQLPFNRANNG